MRRRVSFDLHSPPRASLTDPARVRACGRGRSNTIEREELKEYLERGVGQLPCGTSLAAPWPLEAYEVEPMHGAPYYLFLCARALHPALCTLPLRPHMHVHMHASVRES